MASGASRKAYGFKNWRRQRKFRSTLLSFASSHTAEPALLDRFDLFGREQDCLGIVHQKQRRRFQAQSDLACTLLTHDQHGLGGFSACPILRTDVIGRGQGQFLAVPEGGVVARMVIGISAENVEQHSCKELFESLPWRPKPVANDSRELLITAIAGHEFVELEQREGGNHGFPAPTSLHFHAIEAFDKKDVLSRCALKAHRGNGQLTSAARRMAMYSALTTL